VGSNTSIWDWHWTLGGVGKGAEKPNIKIFQKKIKKIIILKNPKNSYLKLD